MWLPAAAGAELTLSGVVLNGNRVPVPAARVVARGENGRGEWLQVTGARGEFTLTLPGPGRYTLRIDREGHFPLEEKVEVDGAAAPPPLALTLVQARELVQSLEVTSAPLGLDLEATGVRQTVSNNEIVNAPYPNTNDLRSALRIAPGVVRSARGTLHIQGGAEEQVLYTLNGFNIGDPSTGRFETRLSVESVQSVEVLTGSLPAEMGKGSAGAMAIRTLTGDDKPRMSATNFVPGFENRKGIILSDWTPRAGLSGPLRRGRAWFSDSLDLQYTKTVIQDLPKGADRTASFRWSNLLHTQVNLRPGNLLHTSFLATSWNAPRTGLSPLDPLETTTDRRARQWFLSVRDQAFLPGGAVLEVGAAVNRTFGREIPQGQELLEITTGGRRGNAFVDAQRRGGREQLLVNGFLPVFQFAGAHQWKGGVDLNRVTYWQDARRTGYKNISEAGDLLRLTTFGGSGVLRQVNQESAGYVQDSWRLRPALSLELGLRSDWDNVLRRWNLSPRAGVVWSPPGLRDTRLAAGFGRVYDASNLRMFARPYDQFPVTTLFAPGGAVESGPAVTRFTIQDARPARPQHNNWNASLERQWTGAGFSLRADFLRRRGVQGFSYNELDAATPAARILALTNARTDQYDSVTFAARQHLQRQYEWNASYTYSRARSNTVVDMQTDETLRVDENQGPLAWDAPHRTVAWGYLPLPRKNWAVAVLAEYRTGFPYVVVDQTGRVRGAVNTERFPVFFEANLHLERQFAARGHRWAFRFGFNNLTNRRNPTTVNNVADAYGFGTFSGGVGRAGNFRIRWMGRAR
ncbi:MAG: TonB-dependent receptor [Bryobacterales bacterium]|nr:TonB-dependent receptor [Bryobacterales bacterium]